MSIHILMPALSPTMTEGNLAKWLKKEGDKVSSGDILCEIETDKATMEVEAVDEGIIGKIVIPEGSENVAVNQVIAVLLEEGEDASVIQIDSLQAPEKNNKPAETVESDQKESSINTSKEIVIDHSKEERVFASPLAKRIAVQNKIDLSHIQGTGPNGRIVKADLENISTVQKNVLRQTEPSYTDLKVSLMRKTVAKRLTESKNTVPHFYLTIDCEIDALLAARKQLNADDTYRISVNDLIIKACAQTLKKVPDANVTWHDTYIRKHHQADISVAVAVDGGLVTPIVFGADQLSIGEISEKIKYLVQKSRDGKLQPQEYEGGTFTVSNLGMYGIKNFNAIINPPQGCILAVGAGEQKVIVKNGEQKIATLMTVTLSVDHRSIDGAIAAQFLKQFKTIIENPLLMFV